MAESRFFFNHQNKIILKSPFAVLIKFVLGTLLLRLPQGCAVPLYVTHNQVYRNATSYSMWTYGRQAKEKFSEETCSWNTFYFISTTFFRLLFELEKKWSLVTGALSTKSCTRDTDSLFSCLSVSLAQDLAERALVPKLDCYIHEQRNGLAA